MIRYLCKRLLAIIPVGLGVTFIIFSLLYLTPGDPARLALGEDATEEALMEWRHEYGLDRPFITRYGLFVYNAVVHQDMGRSYMTRRPVTGELNNAFPITIDLSIGAIIIATALGLAFGIICAIKQYSLFDNVCMIFAMLGISVPLFYLGILLILWFSVRLRWLPSSGFTTFSEKILPWITLAANSMAIITRMTRSSMLEVIHSDYVRTARAKGQKESIVILRHALKNALLPVVTYLGPMIAAIFTGSFVIESIFAIPGLGRHFVTSIYNRDYTVILGITVFYSALLVFMNFLVDLTYVWLDPRIKLGGEENR